MSMFREPRDLDGSKLHEEAYAAAWEAVPAAAKKPLLHKANCLPKYVPACAQARWHFLPADIQAELKPLLDLNVVRACSRELKERQKAMDT